MPELSRMIVTRMVSTKAALDAAPWPADALVLRTAADELMVYPAQREVSLDDPYAIIIRDGGHAGVWMPMADALRFLERECEWEIPVHRPAFAQGAVAGIPAKLYFEQDRVLFIVAAPFAQDFQNRM
ncbi:MAG: hypothetical protein O3C57_08675 [Verrucomicrobia bacterium]|nr:hypothetical protein [Verrucomicrobiota bacterium]